MILNRDAILAADDLATKTVEVPEWGGEVIVKALSGTERDAFEASLTKRRPIITGPKRGELETIPDLANLHSKLVARCIVDESGARVFTDGDVVELGKKSAAALARVFNAAAELSGIGEDEAQDAEGNSDADPSDGSTSDLPETSE
jgi:hypothetical protein